MIWVGIVIAIVVVLGLAIWRLDQPLWHHARTEDDIRRFIEHLQSPSFPGHVLIVATRSRELIAIRRRRTEASSFEFDLKASGLDEDLAESIARELNEAGFSSPHVDFPTARARVSLEFGAEERGQGLDSATLRILRRLVGDGERLRVRYAEGFDPQVMREGFESGASSSDSVRRAVARFGLRRMRR